MQKRVRPVRCTLFCLDLIGNGKTVAPKRQEEIVIEISEEVQKSLSSRGRVAVFWSSVIK